MAEHNNLLLVTFDQWRGDWGDPYEPVLPLPALESLAQQGWTARRCYTASPHCVPARFSWLTGLAPSQLGLTRNTSVDVPADAPSIVRDLRTAGWHTALVGKTHWTSHANARDLRDNKPLLKALGFEEVIEVAGPRALRRLSCALTDAWSEAGVLGDQRSDLESRYKNGISAEAWTVRPSVLPNILYPDLWIADRALEQIALMPTNQPWILWVSFVGPHEPFDTPVPWHGNNQAEKLPAPKPHLDWLKHLPKDAELNQKYSNWEGKLNLKSIAECRADYADHLQLLDDQLGKLVKHLDQRIDAQRTAVVVTADHGELLGDHGMLYKGALLEPAVRVPWVYRPAPNQVHNTGSWSINPLPLTELIAHTCEIIKGNKGIDSLSLWAKTQPGAVVEFGSERLFIQGARKLVLNKRNEPLWAIHLEQDPDEQNNVINEQTIRWSLNPKWLKLRQWSRQITRKRSESNWVWRQLGSDL